MGGLDEEVKDQKVKTEAAERLTVSQRKQKL